jgi:mRNA interferase MazF
MAETTTTRIDRTLHEELKRLARERGTTVADTVAHAVRMLRQEQRARISPGRWNRRRPTGSMLTSGDVVELDLGVPTGSEAGLVRPAVVITAQRVLTVSPTVIQVVPLTRTLRGYSSEVTITADTTNGLDADSSAQCQHVCAVATARVRKTVGNTAPSPSRRFATSSRCSWISSPCTVEPAIRQRRWPPFGLQWARPFERPGDIGVLSLRALSHTEGTAVRFVPAYALGWLLWGSLLSLTGVG